VILDAKQGINHLGICREGRCPSWVKSEVKLVTQDVCITPESRHHRSSFILRVDYIPQAIDHLAVLRDRHIDAGAALGVDELDSFRHRVGIFAAVLHRFEAQAGAVPYTDLADVCPVSSPQIYG
jgi:hypothetical protein